MAKDTHDPRSEVAARQFYSDLVRPADAAEAAEAGDDAEAVAMEEWAECMVARGVERRTALQCAAAIWELQAGKDRACAGSVVAWAGPVPQAQLLEGLRMIALKIVQAPTPRFSAGCLEIATGLSARSARSWAKEQNRSHELAANEVEDWQRVLGLPKTSGQKSDAARKRYAETNGRTARGGG